MPIEDQLRRLAQFESEDAPVLSVYLDVRPEATGEKPQTRAGLVVLKDRLREIRKTFLPRGRDLDSFEADAKRIRAFARHEMEPSTKGLAIFACAAAGLFETVEVGVPFENQVTVGPKLDLYQLARLLDTYETSIVALVDTNTARLFVCRHGTLDEVGGPDDDAIHYQKRSTGGWSQLRYQRHIDKHRRDFASEVASEIQELSDREEAPHVILAGDEVAITHLQSQLSPRVSGRVRSVLRLDIRAARDDVAREVSLILQDLEEESGISTVEELVAEVRRGGLGVAGLAKTLRSLKAGQVDILVIDGAAPISADARAELVRRAVATGANVEIVDGNPALLQLGGIGARLRYRA